MIAEFALTPSVFEEACHPDVMDWRLWLNTLGHKMFPQRNLCPVMVTDLSGLWESNAKLALDRIGDHRAKGIAQQLFTRIGQRLVRRTLPTGTAQVAQEAWWARSSCTAGRIESIERVVASTACRTTLADTHPNVRELRDVEDEAFWENVSAEWSPTATVSAQVATLRKLCVHGEFVWLATPYAGGTVDDETPFACAFIRDAFRRPAGFAPPREVELHTQLPRNVPIANHFSSVRHSVLDVLQPGQSARHVVWDKFEDRIALAGVFTQTSTGRQHAPRWGVHMGHVARPTDAGRGLSHEWKQLTDDRVGYWFKHFGERQPPRFVDIREIRCE